MPQDYIQAVEWFRKAAEQGFADAHYNLGNMYANGWGVRQDYEQAVQWFRKATNQGHAGALHNFGTMYGNGRGVPRNNVQAHKWFDLAASRAEAGEVRDKATKGRDTVARRMTPTQVTEAQRLAREWLAKFESRKK